VKGKIVDEDEITFKRVSLSVASVIKPICGCPVFLFASKKKIEDFETMGLGRTKYESQVIPESSMIACLLD